MRRVTNARAWRHLPRTRPTTRLPLRAALRGGACAPSSRAWYRRRMKGGQRACPLPLSLASRCVNHVNAHIFAYILNPATRNTRVCRARFAALIVTSRFERSLVVGANVCAWRAEHTLRGVARAARRKHHSNAASDRVGTLQTSAYRAARRGARGHRLNVFSDKVE